ncbi:MAG: multicopper oxidase family protein [Methylococcaceae bacterium]|nr:MAG: multicopper oxidase family protein [Methylococcaceae bacterium]
MTSVSHNSRRQFLRTVAFSALAGALPIGAIANPGRFYPTRKASPDFHPDMELDLIAREITVPILPGKETAAWTYEAKLLKGPEGTVKDLRGSYLGDLIQLRKGQKVRINFRNQLPTDNIVHWHGMHVPQAVDGHPMWGIEQGDTYVYEFEVLNPAGTYMYHAHTHNATGHQVYWGLAGLMLVNDSEEQALNLPSGAYDVPVVIQDRSFDADNQFRYISHMRERMMGFLGERILVNGHPKFVLPVNTRAYRLRVVNASNSRIYKLGWDDGTPLTVIGTDGGLLERPATRSYLMLAPGERVDLWADFSDRKVGSEMVMRSLPFHGVLPAMHERMMGEHGGGMMGGQNSGDGGMNHGMKESRDGDGGMGMMGGGMMGHSRGPSGGGEHLGHAREASKDGMMSPVTLPLGDGYELFRVHVMEQEHHPQTLPPRLATIKRYRREEAANAQAPRHIALTMQHMGWRLNGKTFSMEDVAPEEKIPLNSLQVIEFDNGYTAGHGMMNMAHPMHIHGQPFQVLRRDINPAMAQGYATVKDGFVDEGWKDTVLVMPGEKVTLLKRFDDFPGLFLYHCHNLEHEELGMMRNFLVG